MKKFAEALRRMPPERLFLLLFVPLEILAMVWVPIGVPPDEPAHLRAVWRISAGQFQTETYVYPRTVYEQIADDRDPEAAAHLSSARVSEDTVSEPVNEATEVYPVLAYAPQAALLSLARLFTDRVMILFLAARLGSMLVTTWLFWLAIRRMPAGRYILTAVAFLPLTLQETASASCDGMTVAGISLVIATFLRFITGKEPLTGRRIFGLSLLSAGTVIWKLFYIPVLALAALLPGRKASLPRAESTDTTSPQSPGSSGKRKAILAVLFGVLAALGIWYLTSMRQNLGRGGMTSGAVSRFSEVLADPIGFLGYQFRTIVSRFGGWVLQFFGVLGHLDRISPAWVWLPLAACFLTVCALDTKAKTLEPDPKRRLRLRLVLILSLLLCWQLIAGGLLIWWTKPGSSLIEGIQSRYFLPVLSGLILCLPEFRCLDRFRGVAPLWLLPEAAFSLITFLTLF